MYDEEIQTKKINKELEILTKNSENKLKKSEDKINKLINNFKEENNNTYISRLNEADIDITKKYKQLETKSKY